MLCVCTGRHARPGVALWYLWSDVLFLWRYLFVHKSISWPEMCYASHGMVAGATPNFCPVLPQLVKQSRTCPGTTPYTLRPDRLSVIVGCLLTATRQTSISPSLSLPCQQLVPGTQKVAITLYYDVELHHSHANSS